MGRWTSSQAACVAAVALVTLAGAGALQAATVPNASVSGTALLNRGDREDLVGFGAVSVQGPGIGSASFAASGSPFPLLTASAEAGPNIAQALLFNRGTGIARYHFQVDGNSADVPVAIDVAGAVSALATPGASFVVASSWILWDSPGLTQILASDEVQTPQSTGSFAQGFSRTVHLTLLTNHVYTVELRVDAEAAASEPGSQAQANAFVDPYFYVDLGVDANAYVFSFSPGVTNAPAVPEPGAVWLMAVGVVLVTLRRLRS